MIKQKLVISSRTEKIKLLTLTPPSWTIEQTKYFGVKKCMVKKARELLKNKGLHCEPDERTRKSIVTAVGLFQKILLNTIAYMY